MAVLLRSLGLATGVALTLGLTGWLVLYAAPRPPDTTDPAVFAVDGAALDYCRARVLEGPGLLADDIPKAYTPGCGWTRWPAPVLADCAEPLAEGAADLRGLWQGQLPDGRTHVERIEQCGDRVVVTAAGIIHDFRADGSLARGSRDIEPPSCMNTWVAVEWDEGVLDFQPFGLGVTAVTRRRAGNRLLWSYPGLGEIALDRVCRVSQEARNLPLKD